MTPPPIKKVTVKPRGAHPVPLKGLKTLEDLLGNVPPSSPPREIKRSFIGKCIEIIRHDIKERFNGARALVKDPPNGWQDYRQFCDLARGKGKN